MRVQLLKDKLPDILTHFEAVSLVYLFSSRATGKVEPISDYDLGVLVDRDADEDQIQAQFSHKVSRILGTDRVDVVVLNRVPVELAYAVIARGKRLYERDVVTRVEYEADVMSRYGDYLPVLRAQREDILRGDKHGTRVQWYRAALERTERTLGQIVAAQRKTSDRV